MDRLDLIHCWWLVIALSYLRLVDVVSLNSRPRVIKKKKKKVGRRGYRGAAGRSDDGRPVF